MEFQPAGVACLGSNREEANGNAGWLGGPPPTPQFSTFVPNDPVQLCERRHGDIVVMTPYQVPV